MSTRTWSSPASRLGRRGLLTLYAILIAVPLVVVVATSLKSTPQLYADPVGLPKPPTLPTSRRCSPTAASAAAF